MARVVIDHHGDKIYRNDEGQYHREGGPAFISNDGLQMWFENNKWIVTKNQNGELHRRTEKSSRKFSYPSGYFVFKQSHGFVVWPELE